MQAWKFRYVLRVTVVNKNITRIPQSITTPWTVVVFLPEIDITSTTVILLYIRIRYGNRITSGMPHACLPPDVKKNEVFLAVNGQIFVSIELDPVQLPAVEYIRNVTVNSTPINEDCPVATKSWQEIPGLKSLPLIGQSHHFLPGGSLYKTSFNDMFKKLFTIYGPIVRLDGLVGIPPMIILYDAENSAKVLRGENLMPVRPELKTLDYYRKIYAKNGNDNPTGLLTEHGEVWKRFRSMVNPVMLQPKTIKLYTTALDEVAQDMIARMKSLRGEDNILKCDFDTEMNLWALESIGVVALGDRLNCFDPNLPEDSPAKQLIKTVHDFFTIVEKLEFQPSLWKYFSTPTFKRAMKIYEETENLTKYFIRNSMEKLNTKNEKSDDEKGVLEKLIDIDEQVAFTMASDMLFAGVDSTANAFIYALYLVAKNPQKQEKSREEVMSGRDQRPYLKACIKESTRLYPIAFGNIRQTTKEYNLMGYKIPKDMYIAFYHQGMSISETHFKRAREFIPERWLVPNTDPLYHGNAHPFAHSPFGFGVRSCIGRRIAELEIETFLAQILKNFNVEWFGPPLKLHQTSITYATGPFNFTFKDI